MTGHGGERCCRIIWINCFDSGLIGRGWKNFRGKVLPELPCNPLPLFCVRIITARRCLFCPSSSVARPLAAGLYLVKLSSCRIWEAKSFPDAWVKAQLSPWAAEEHPHPWEAEVKKPGRISIR